MKVSVLLFVAFVIQIDQSNAWGIRLPRWVCNSVCSVTCVAVTGCPHCAPGCSWGCSNVCKRSVNKRAADDGKFILRLPCKFKTWDTNGDGSVSLGEFAFTGHTGANKATEAVFKKVDKNGDGKISKKELDKSSIVRGDC